MKILIVTLIWILSGVIMCVEIENMPQRDTEELYSENTQRNIEKDIEDEKISTKDENNKSKTKNVVKNKANNVKKEKIAEIKTKLNDQKDSYEKIDRRLIYDYENIFTIKELKELHNSIEKIYYKTGILIVLLSDFNKNGRKRSIEESMIKYFSRKDKDVLLIERNKNNINFYFAGEQSNLYLYNELEKIKNNILSQKIESYYQEAEKVLEIIEKFYSEKDNIDVKRKVKTIKKTEKNNKKIKFFIFLNCFIFTIYLITEVIIYKGEKKVGR